MDHTGGTGNENVRDDECFGKADSADKMSGENDIQNKRNISEVDHTGGTEDVRVQLRPGQTKNNVKNRQKQTRLGATKETTNMAEGLSHKTGLKNKCIDGDVNIITNAEVNVHNKCKKTENSTTNSQLRPRSRKRKSPVRATWRHLLMLKIRRLITRKR